MSGDKAADVKQLERLKSELQAQLQEAARWEGRRSALLDQIKEAFGVDGLDGARKKLKDLEAELAKATAALNESLEALAKFEADDDQHG